MLLCCTRCCCCSSSSSSSPDFPPSAQGGSPGLFCRLLCDLLSLPTFYMPPAFVPCVFSSVIFFLLFLFSFFSFFGVQWLCSQPILHVFSWLMMQPLLTTWIQVRLTAWQCAAAPLHSGRSFLSAFLVNTAPAGLPEEDNSPRIRLLSTF